jgi:hypothetical protein
MTPRGRRSSVKTNLATAEVFTDSCRSICLKPEVGLCTRTKNLTSSNGAKGEPMAYHCPLCGQLFLLPEDRDPEQAAAELLAAFHGHVHRKRRIEMGLLALKASWLYSRFPGGSVRLPACAGFLAGPTFPTFADRSSSPSTILESGAEPFGHAWALPEY